MLQQPIQQLYQCSVESTQQIGIAKCTVVIRKKDLSDQIIDKQTYLIQKLKTDNASLKKILQLKNTEITKLKLAIDQLQTANIQINQQYLTSTKHNQTLSLLQAQNSVLKQKIRNYEGQLGYSLQVQQKELNKLQTEIKNLQNQNIFLRQLNDNSQRQEIPITKQLQELQKKCRDLEKELIVQRKVNQTLFKQTHSKSTASYPLKESQTPAICIEEQPIYIKEPQDLQDPHKTSKNFMVQTKTLLHQSCYSVESIQNNDKSMTYQKSQAQIQTEKYDLYQPVVSRERLQKSLSSRRNNHMKSVDENTRLLTLSRELNQKEEEIKQLVKKMEKQKKNSESVKSQLKKKEKQLKMMKKNSIKKQIVVVDDDNKDDTSPIQILQAESKIQHPQNEDVQDQHYKIEVEQFQATGQHNQEYVIQIREESQLKDVTMQTEQPRNMQQNQSESQWKAPAKQLQGELQLKTNSNELSQQKPDKQQVHLAISQAAHDYTDNLLQRCLHLQEQQDQRQPNQQVNIKQVQNSIEAINVLRTENDQLRRLLQQTEDLLEKQQRRNSQKGSAAPVVAQTYLTEQMNINLMIMHDEDSQNGAQLQLVALRTEVQQLRRQLITNTEQTVELAEVVTQTEHVDQKDRQQQIIQSDAPQIIARVDVNVKRVDLAQRQIENTQYEQKLQTKQKQLIQKSQVIREMTLTVQKYKEDNQQIRKMLSINQQLLNHERQQAQKDKSNLQSIYQQQLFKQTTSKQEAIEQAQVQIYALTLAETIAQQFISQHTTLIQTEQANIADDFFLPQRAPAFLLNSQEDNLFQSNFSLGNLDNQFHLKYQRLVKQMQGLRDENKYLHEMLSLMKSSEEDRSCSENKDMVVSFNIKQSKILSLQQLLAIPLKSSAVHLGSDRVRSSSQDIQSLLKVPQARKIMAQMPKLQNVYASSQNSLIKSPYLQRQKVQRLGQQLQIKERQIAQMAKQLERLQSKLQRTRRNAKKSREEKSINQQIQIQEEQIVFLQVETQTHPQTVDSLSNQHSLEDLCDELQYRLQIQTHKNKSLNKKIKKYRSAAKKLQQQPASDNTEEIQIEQQAVQMCEVQVQTDLSNFGSQKPSNETVREKMKQTGKLFLNVIQNLQQKYIDQDSEENESENFQEKGKQTAKSTVGSSQARLKEYLDPAWNRIDSVFKRYDYTATNQLQVDSFPQQLQLFIQFLKTHYHTASQDPHQIVQTTPKVDPSAKDSIIHNSIDVSKLQLLFIEHQRISFQHERFPYLNPLFITPVTYAPSQSQTFIDAVLKLAPLPVHQIRSLLNDVVRKLSELELPLEEEKEVEQSTLQEIVRLCGGENIQRLILGIEK